MIGDSIGQKFGKWIVKEEKYFKNKNTTFCLCYCDCGTIRWVRKNSLRIGRSTNCGCVRKESVRLVGKNNITHNLSASKIYNVWRSFKKRCLLVKNDSYKNYGGRGIKVCNRWLESFENFYEDMGSEYKEGLSIDRIDNNGNYCKENCRWATQKEQANNMSTNHIIKYKNKSMNISQWAKYLNINKNTIISRLRYGWSIKDVFEIPVRK